MINNYNVYSIEQEQAAVVIQRCVRQKFLARMSLYRDLCLKAEANNMPRAKGGHTIVYLPSEANVVLKKAGLLAKVRHQQSNRLRVIAKSLQLKHVVVPKEYFVLKNFCVADRLPIDIDSTYNLNMYLKDPRLFDEALSEMTMLFSKVYFRAMIQSESASFFSRIITCQTLRYDNFPLYIEEIDGKRVGKIGLIDAEHVEYCQDEEGLENLAEVFPLHQQIIKVEALRLGMDISRLEKVISRSKGKFLCEVQTLLRSVILPPKSFIKAHELWLKRSGAANLPTRMMKEIPPEIRQQTIEWMEETLMSCEYDSIKMRINRRLLKKLQEENREIDEIPMDDLKRFKEVSQAVKNKTVSLYDLVIDKLKFLIVNKNLPDKEILEEIKGQLSLTRAENYVDAISLEYDVQKMPYRQLYVDMDEIHQEMGHLVMADPLLKTMKLSDKLRKMAEGVIFDLREKVIYDYKIDFSAAFKTYYHIAY